MNLGPRLFRRLSTALTRSLSSPVLIAVCKDAYGSEAGGVRGYEDCTLERGFESRLADDIFVELRCFGPKCKAKGRTSLQPTPPLACDLQEEDRRVGSGVGERRISRVAFKSF